MSYAVVEMPIDEVIALVADGYGIGMLCLKCRQSAHTMEPVKGWRAWCGRCGRYAAIIKPKGARL